MRSALPSRSSHARIAGAYLVLALLLGGGGSPAPFAELAVQLAALAALATWWLRRDPVPRALDRVLWAGAALLALIPVLQLTPVPPAIWASLPGRENVVAAISLIGRADEWRPISIAPARTVASLLSLIPPLAMMWFASQLGTRERTGLLWIVAGVGLASAVLATLQVGTGTALIFYQPHIPTPPPGIMASRNAQGDLLVLAMVAVVALASIPHPRLPSAGRLAMAGVVLAVLGAALFLSGSRSGVALLAVPFAVAGYLWLAPALRHAQIGRRQVLLAAGAALALAGGLAAIARDNAVIAGTLERFEAETDGRFEEIWPDALEAAKVMWPAGGGMGTFIPAFESVERLEVVNESEPNRAHNDYLEFVIEAGLAAVLLLAAAITVLAWRIARMLKSSRGRPEEPVVVFAASVLLVVGLHSLVDYPLRAMTIAVLAGYAVGSLSRRPAQPAGSRVDD
ncbi:O-antigen ligase family protein [Tsuneonella sp. SYSU-LHT278]|uniref:O-antigen ligase family protein n=1 Tax=Tsuneonella sediminis TaxID=3416089 RepID=UPI003F7A6276